MKKPSEKEVKVLIFLFTRPPFLWVLLREQKFRAICLLVGTRALISQTRYLLGLTKGKESLGWIHNSFHGSSFISRRVCWILDIYILTNRQEGNIKMIALWLVSLFAKGGCVWVWLYEPNRLLYVSLDSRILNLTKSLVSWVC